jgi:hypothetical protein
MAQNLSWMALGLSAMALLHALVRAGRAKPGPALGLKPFLLSTAGILVLGALLTLPTGSPWSRGQTLAPGFLLGGGAVLLAALAGRLQRLADPADEARRRLLILALGRSLGIAGATLGVSLLLLIYGGQAMDALGGYALGALTAGLILAGGIRLWSEDPEALEVAALAELTALACIVLAATTHLATFHRNAANVREWQPLAALFTATLAVGLAGLGALSGGAATRGAGRGWVRTLAVVFLPLLVMAGLIAFRLNGTPAFLWAVLTGLVVYGLIAWLEWTEAQGIEPQGTRARGLVLRADLGLLASLLAIGGGVLAFRELHGYGAGIAVLAGLAVASVMPPPPETRAAARPLLWGALALGLIPVLYRVYVEVYEYHRGPEPDFYYYYVALVLGALLPPFIARSISRWMQESVPAETAEGVQNRAIGEDRQLSALLRIGLAGLGAAVTPLLLWLLVGDRPLAGFLMGLPIGIALLMAGLGMSGNREGAVEVGSVGTLTRLLAIGMALSANQFTELVKPIDLVSRSARVWALVAVGVVALVWIVAIAWRERRPVETAATTGE